MDEFGRARARIEEMTKFKSCESGMAPTVVTNFLLLPMAL